ncbi:MAG: hypothetical protein H7Z41_15130, partial [Cytophagales bacterium]|nr:hypothetical protein [Armatimonadota bacterium]
LNGVVGTTTGGFYVWGVNRGTGTAGFSSLGLDGVLFDSVVIVRPNGASQVIVGGVPTTLGSGINFSGNTLSALVSGSLLPSTGFAPSQYTINLWPRTASTLSNGAVGGNAAISDFAPNNSNVLVTTTAPEPGSLTLAMLGGLTVAGTILRRRRA